MVYESPHWVCERENVLPKVKRFQKRPLPRRRSKKSRSSLSSIYSEAESVASDIPAVVFNGSQGDRLAVNDTLSLISTTPGPSPFPEFNDSDYDTDLADEAPEEDFDITGRKVYLAACKKHGVVPSNYVARAFAGECLKMNDFGMAPNDVLALCVPLLMNMTISTLILSSNRIGPEGMVYLAAMLKENINISTLDVSYNALGTKGAQLLADILDANGTMKVLNVAGNNFQDDDSKYFAYIIRTSRLKVLNLSHNGFREKAGHILGQAIAENDMIEELDLCWNHFRLKGARAIANGIMENVSIKKLDLSWNGFSNDGCKCICNVLVENRVLQDLDLSSNRITLEGVKHLCRGLLKNETLVKLKLSKNSIGTAGVSAILEAIKAHSSSHLQTLEILDTYVDPTVDTLIAEVKKVKPKFRVKHGAMMRFVDPYKEIVRPRDAWMGDPLTLLLRYMTERNMRLMDLFSQFDTDDSWTLTTSEFKEGVKQAHIPLSALQLEQLVNRLDKNKDGEIDFKEMLSGHKKYRDRERRIRQEQTAIDRLRSFNSSSPTSPSPISGRMSGNGTRQSISSPSGTPLSKAASPRGSISTPKERIQSGGRSGSRGSISSPKTANQLRGASSPRGSLSSPMDAKVSHLPMTGMSPRGSISSLLLPPLRGDVDIADPVSIANVPKESPIIGVATDRKNLELPMASLLRTESAHLDAFPRPRSSVLPSLVKPIDGKIGGTGNKVLDDMALTDSKWLHREKTIIPDTRWLDQQKHQ